MKTLISMELSPSEAKQEVAIDTEAPKYPWGLCIDLNDDALKKLGIDTLPKVGDTVSIVAKAEVSSASESQYQGEKEKHRTVSLQITDMSVASVVGDIQNVLYNA